MEKAESIKSYFSRAASSYEAKSNAFPWRLLRTPEMAALFSLLDHNKAEHLLEIGCGAGLYSKAIKERYGIAVHAVEFCPEMAALAAEHCEKIYLTDFQSLEESTTYQSILCAGALEFMDCSSAWKKIKRISQPKASVFLLYPRGGLTGIAYSLAHRALGCPVQRVSEKSLVRIAKDNGFELRSSHGAGPLAKVYLFEKE